MFMRIVKVYVVLMDEEFWKNWEEFGNLDGF